MQITRYNAFAIVILGFQKSESDIGNDILSTSSDIVGKIGKIDKSEKSIYYVYQEYVTGGFHRTVLKFLSVSNLITI